MSILGDAELSDGVIALGPWRLTDVSAFVAAQDEAWRRGFWRPASQTLKQARESIRRAIEDASRGSADHRMAARFVGTEELVGEVRVHPSARDATGLVLSVWVAPAHRASGLGKRLVRLASGHAFATGTPWIEAEIRPGNRASERMVRRLGFVRWTERFRLDRSPVDVYRLTAERWRAFAR